MTVGQFYLQNLIEKAAAGILSWNGPLNYLVAGILSLYE